MKLIDGEVFQKLMDSAQYLQDVIDGQATIPVRVVRDYLKMSELSPAELAALDAKALAVLKRIKDMMKHDQIRDLERKHGLEEKP